MSERALLELLEALLRRHIITSIGNSWILLGRS